MNPQNTEFEGLFNQKMYWREKYRNCYNETFILPDFMRPNDWEGNIETVEFKIQEDPYERIMTITNNSPLTLFITLTSFVIVLLQKYTGNTNLTIGIASFSPGQEQSNGMVPVFASVDEDSTFRELLPVLGKLVCEAYGNQDIAFDEIIELVSAEKHGNRCSIFDIIVALKNIHGEVSIKKYKSDIGFIFSRTETGITLKIEYNASLYRAATIDNLGKLYLAVLNTVLQDMHVRIGSISLMAEADYRLIFNVFNNNFKDFSTYKSIPQVFEEQAECKGDCIAVEHRGRCLTYMELNQEANRLARLLVRFGVGKGKFVAILEERSINFLISMLAVVKAGAAFIPIDPVYPEDRFYYMISNSEASEIITSNHHFKAIQEAILKAPHLRTIISLDSQGLEAYSHFGDIKVFYRKDYENLSGENLDFRVPAINPVYMIYTSGSTGLPKGAINRHDGVLNHMYAEMDMIGVDGYINFLQSAPTSTDISMWQFFTGVLLGGRTTIIDYNDFCNPEVLLNFLEEKKITLMEVVPSFLRVFVEYLKDLPADKRQLSYLKCIIVTGEAASVQVINDWLLLFPHIKAANAYGPTEASDDITQYIIEAPMQRNILRVPIGKPLANLTIYIFNSQMQLQPVGIPGEIGVSGIGVGDGYWKNEDLNKKFFVKNIFDEKRGEIIYKTGDIGMWLPDGNIDLLGRKDQQVKVSGYRIEIEEIRYHLLRCHNVRDAYVTYRDSLKGNMKLCAYVVMRNNTDAQATTYDQFCAGLRDELAGMLPRYMVPHYIVKIDEIPLMPNGKIDRLRLPVPQSQMDNTCILPRNEAEEKLVDIWAGILGIDKSVISIDSNFFDLGGNSISIIALKAEIMKKFNRNLSIVDLFRMVCIRDLSAFLSNEEDLSAKIIKDELLEESAKVMNETLGLFGGEGNE
jgi:amino acid adenylation domain-containing protein